MLKATFGIFLCIVAVANARHAASFLRNIQPKALPGITDCGVSELVDVRIQGCTSAPCQLTAGSTYTLSVDYKPREQHYDMIFHMIILQDTTIDLITEGPIPDSTIEAGQQYTFEYTFTVNSPFKGAADIRLKYYQNYVHELCLVIPVNIA